ncbi:hypothetical protein PHYSODRAFT_482091, partial [Phytophthora sojae]
IPFDSSIATASGLYGVRIGSQGLSLSHFRHLSDDERLKRSSNNTNFSLDFSSAAQPPQPAECTTYDDILLALSGLSSFGATHWYPHMNRLLDQLRRFVFDNQRADPANTSERVTRTLQYANVYLGRAVAHLSEDSEGFLRRHRGNRVQVG